MKKILLFILLISIAALCAETTSVQADSLKKHPQPKYKLEGVSVVAEKPTQAIGKIEVKKWDEREAVSETNIADAVLDIPGLNISQGGKSGSELSIRGFEKEDVMIMLDGRPIGGGYFDAVDLTTLPVSEIKEIQVIKGPASSLYGSNTMGGVVNILSKKADNSSWVKAMMQLQRNNTSRVQLSSAHQLGDYHYLLSLGRYSTDGYSLSEDFIPTAIEDGDVRDHTAKEQYDMQARFDYDLFDFHKIGFLASYTWMDEREVPTSTHEIYIPEYPGAVFKKYVDWKRYQFSANGMFQLDWNQKLNVDLYYDGYDDTYQTYYQPDYTDLGLDSRLLSWNLGAITKYTLEMDNSDIIAGYRIERQAFKRKDNQSYSEWTDNWQILQNPFVQGEYNLGNLTISGGSGFSVFHQNGREDWIFHIEPSLGLYYKSKSFGEYNLALSNNVNYPSLHELFSHSSGNPDLQEESAWKFELSTLQPFTFGKTAGNIEIAGFYNIIDNMVDKVLQDDGYTLIFDNFDQVRSYGAEAGFMWKFITEHQIQYRYLDYAEGSDRPLNENPRNMVDISEKFYLPWKLFFVYDSTWNDITTSENVQLDSFWVHNFYVNRNFGRYKVKLGIENAFDENYEEKYGYPMPGRDFILTIEAEI